jgi:hypothetical protein
MNTSIITKFSNSLATECVVNTAVEAEQTLNLATQLNQLTSGLIAFVLKQVHDKELYKEYGVKSTAAFGEKILNVSRSTVSEYVKVGKYFISPNATVFKNESGDFSTAVLVECIRQKLTDDEIAELPRNITVKEVRKKKQAIESDGTELESDNSTTPEETKETPKEPAKESDKFKYVICALNGEYEKHDDKIVTRDEIVKHKTELEKDGFRVMIIYGDTTILMAALPQEKFVSTLYEEYKKI